MHCQDDEQQIEFHSENNLFLLKKKKKNIKKRFPTYVPIQIENKLRWDKKKEKKENWNTKRDSKQYLDRACERAHEPIRMKLLIVRSLRSGLQEWPR